MAGTALNFLLFLLFCISCTRAPLKTKEGVFRSASAPTIQDDLPLESLISGIQNVLVVLKQKPPQDEAFLFDKIRLTNAQYIEALEKLLKMPTDPTQFYLKVKENFDFYEVYGASRWGEVLLTSYFTPRIKGALRKQEGFSQPLYAKPNDLLEVFLPKIEGKVWDVGALRGRLVDKKVLPYFSREEIDGRQLLKKRKLEICWVDPLDAFILHIQGSGFVELTDNTSITVGYSDQNGFPYQPIGKYLTDKIPLEKMSLQKIESHLRGLSFNAMQDLLFKNPSYIFFQAVEGFPKTQMGVPVVEGRTIATDSRYFPKGMVGFLQFEKPKFSGPSDEEPVAWEKTSRFVIDTDTGGVIKGPGRVDLFWGIGAPGKQSAGVIRQKAKLYYLVPKQQNPSS